MGESKIAAPKVAPARDVAELMLAKQGQDGGQPPALRLPLAARPENAIASTNQPSSLKDTQVKLDTIAEKPEHKNSCNVFDQEDNAKQIASVVHPACDPVQKTSAEEPARTISPSIPSTEATDPKKKRKREDAVDEDDDIDITDKTGSEDLFSMTRVELVKECRNQKLKTLGRKEDLLRRLLAKRRRKEPNSAVTKADLLMLKRSELQQECHNAGLSFSGSKQQLATRLLENNITHAQIAKYYGNQSETDKSAASKLHTSKQSSATKTPLPMFRPLPYQTRGRSESEIDAASVIVSLALRRDHTELLNGFTVKDVSTSHNFSTSKKTKLSQSQQSTELARVKPSAVQTALNSSFLAPTPIVNASTPVHQMPSSEGSNLTKVAAVATELMETVTPRATVATSSTTSPVSSTLKSTSATTIKSVVAETTTGSIEEPTDTVPEQQQSSSTRKPSSGKGAKASSKLTTPRRWTRDEDQALIKAVNHNGGTNWKAIAMHVPGRNHEQCLQRWRKALDPRVVKGKWSPEEDRLLLSLLEQSPKNWGYVAMGIVGRTAKQCRERFHSHLDPAIKKGDWKPLEDKLLVQHQKLLGNRWAEISRALRRAGYHGRTENSVKIRWKVLQRKEKRKRLMSASVADSLSNGTTSTVENPSASVNGPSVSVNGPSVSVNGPSVSVNGPSVSVKGEGAPPADGSSLAKTTHTETIPTIKVEAIQTPTQTSSYGERKTQVAVASAPSTGGAVVTVEGDSSTDAVVVGNPQDQLALAVAAPQKKETVVVPEALLFVAKDQVGANKESDKHVAVVQTVNRLVSETVASNSVPTNIALKPMVVSAPPSLMGGNPASAPVVVHGATETKYL